MLRLAEFVICCGFFLVPLLIGGAVADLMERREVKKRKSPNVGFKALKLAK